MASFSIVFRSFSPVFFLSVLLSACGADDGGNDINPTVSPEPSGTISPSPTQTATPTPTPTPTPMVDGTEALPGGFIGELPLELVKTGPSTLSWSSSNAQSCVITNNVDSATYTVSEDDLPAGQLVHAYSSETNFFIECDYLWGDIVHLDFLEPSNSDLDVVSIGVSESSAVPEPVFSNSVGFFSYNEEGTSWATIVSLDTPIGYLGPQDFNTQVDTYCKDLGFEGAANTRTGTFSTDDTYFVRNDDDLFRYIYYSNPVAVVQDRNLTSNVYFNKSHKSFGYVVSSQIYQHWGYGVVAVESRNDLNGVSTFPLSPRERFKTTSGDNQAVLCQTTIPVEHAFGLSQSIYFLKVGPITKVLDFDPPFINRASVFFIGAGGDGEISYSSSNTNVAIVDPESGEVELVGLGQTIITATKAEDIFGPASASYLLIVRAPLPIEIVDFVKTGPSTLRWETTGAGSCEIMNSQNNDVITLETGDLASGDYLHALPEETQFTLSCEGEDGSLQSESVVTEEEDLYPNSVGFYGSFNLWGSNYRSWVAIVTLNEVISYSDQVDFNTQVDNYCVDLGYVGVVKTSTGDFARNSDHYLHYWDNIILQRSLEIWDATILNNGYSANLMVLPEGAEYTNIYTNNRNVSGAGGEVGRATLSVDYRNIDLNITSPTSGENPMVLCQTDLLVRNSYGLSQEIAFEDSGPITKVQGLDSTFTNLASGGLGSGDFEYFSSDESVATVNSTSGEVTLFGLGSATISAVKYSDGVFAEAQSSYELIHREPIPVSIRHFVKSSDASLSWRTSDAQSCVITNDLDSATYSIDYQNLVDGTLVHRYPSTTQFELNCNGGLADTTATEYAGQASDATSLGFHGPDKEGATFAAIVNLNNPITYTDAIDFRVQVDNYCRTLGYAGDAIFESSFRWPYDVLQDVINIIPDDEVYENVYVFKDVVRQETDFDAIFFYPGVVRAAIGTSGDSIDNIEIDVASPTSGDGPMVLCETEIGVENIWLRE